MLKSVQVNSFLRPLRTRTFTVLSLVNLARSIPAFETLLGGPPGRFCREERAALDLGVVSPSPTLGTEVT